ncbi:hypothetical protein [Nocardia sp. NPDC050175]|uniref:hypothetical protein n=1 Tax=Nocardia sp. NPDC050175 TaxID=3364317 RepID=UPI0037B6A466
MTTQQQRAQGRAEWQAQFDTALKIAEFTDLVTENDAVPGRYRATVSLHRPSGKWLIDLWPVQGYLNAEELRDFAEAVIAAVRSGQDFTTEFQSRCRHQDPFFVSIGAERENEGG